MATVTLAPYFRLLLLIFLHRLRLLLRRHAAIDIDVIAALPCRFR